MKQTSSTDIVIETEGPTHSAMEDNNNTEEEDDDDDDEMWSDAEEEDDDEEDMEDDTEVCSQWKQKLFYAFDALQLCFSMLGEFDQIL